MASGRTGYDERTQSAGRTDGHAPDAATGAGREPLGLRWTHLPPRRRAGARGPGVPDAGGSA